MKILVYPHEILRTKAEPVREITGELQGFIDRMIEKMYRAEGVGLAANQVGKPIQLLVMDVTPSEAGANPVVVINPIITETEGSATHEEGCLSVPNYSAKITRPARVEVKGYDRHGKEIRLEGDGLISRCLQHEIDHLHGICFVDRLSPLKKGLFRKKWAKIRPPEEDAG
ncbi:MAG: peptide deformylase [Thermodesulfatator sp.]|nr:MAG: peptide deformylase [Thermodesulfatator sp.]